MTKAKRLTDERLAQIREWMAKRAGDSNLSYDEGVILLLLGHIASLTPPTPEEVAEHVEAVQQALVMGAGERERRHARLSLTRLGDWAARAQGLEARADVDRQRQEELDRARYAAERAQESAEAERDAARQEAAALSAQLVDATRAMGEEMNALRSQVATLERETMEALPLPKAGIAYAGHLPSFVRAIVDAHQKQLADAYDAVSATHLERAEAAERRVAELEATILARAEAHKRTMLQLRDATHPAPAGLLEAVPKVVAPFVALADTLRERADYYEMKDGEVLLEEEVLETTAAFRAQITAGDAREFAAFAAAKGGARDATCPNCKADHDDARKYREARERAKDAYGLHNHAVTAYLNARDHHKVIGVDVAPVVATAVLSYVLGLTLDTPPSGPGGGEPCELCRTTAGHMPMCPRFIAPTPTPEAIAAVPVPATADEARVVMESAGVDPDAFLAEARAHADAVLRSRIAPTPDVPPLAFKSDASMPPTEARLEVDGKEVARIGNLQPEPAAPEVVWEGDGVRVYPNGNIESDAPWTVRPMQVAQMLARALAEAKREAPSPREVHEMRKAHGAVQLSGTDGVVTCFGSGDSAVLVMPHSVYKSDTRKAAEAMRERARAALQSEIDHGEWSDTARDMLMNVADALRALPLEDK